MGKSRIPKVGQYYKNKKGIIFKVLPDDIEQMIPFIESYTISSEKAYLKQIEKITNTIKDKSKWI